MSTKRVAIGLLAAGLVTAGPCDIYADGKTPCVAAHSTTRALYNGYSDCLYQVTRASDNSTADVHPLHPGGVANAGTQDSFCKGTSCTITIIYDQSGHGNDLTPAPPGSAGGGLGPGGYDLPSDATLAPISLNGKKVYGVYIKPGNGYRTQKATGTATKDEPEGHMEAIYFGKGDGTGRGTGAGSGPWIMGDLENLLADGFNIYNNPNLPTITWRFVTAIVKGKPNHWAIRGGNSQSGPMETFYDGVRPNATGYYPMSKEGSIILGIGGDNSHGAEGTFYEGVMTTGYPTDETEALVQRNIVAAKYSAKLPATGPPHYG